MLYYNSYIHPAGTIMTHHHHHHGAPHPSPPISPSLLRFSVLQRLAIAAVPVALIWAAFLWAAR
jgi:hypothetical protein